MATVPAVSTAYDGSEKYAHGSLVEMFDSTWFDKDNNDKKTSRAPLLGGNSP